MINKVPRAHRQRDVASLRRRLVFPVLLNAWPLLLLVSQKALVPFGMLLAGLGTRAARRDALIAAVLIVIGGTALAAQVDNEYGLAHFVGYALFILSVPLINTGVRASRSQLVRWVAILSVVNAVLAFGFYAFEIDLTNYRGLNRIIGDDDETHRVYFEATSLLAVFSVSSFRRRSLRWLCIAIVAIYALFLARSVFVVLLFLLNRYAYHVLHGSIQRRLATFAALLFAALSGPFLINALRPDFALSVAVKLLQFDHIFAHSIGWLNGAGWGYVIDEIINSPDQPYQVEMQLPMLVLQMGAFGFAAYAVGVLVLVRSISTSESAAWLRWLTYMAVGFINPWMLIPSWYLTVSLMYDSLESRRK